MKKHLLFYLTFLLIGLSAISQRNGLVAGPMLGPVELREARLWVEVTPQVKAVALRYYKKGEPALAKTKSYKGVLGQDFNPIQLLVGGLEPATTYMYEWWVDGKPSGAKGSFTTKTLWQWRDPAPDFSFLTGSCAYFNEPAYDRPGTPYGKDTSIFLTMAKENAAFMLWLGDNWYTREVDFAEWGLWYRAHHDRAQPVLRDLLKKMPQYATWDDHDYGPNDIGTNFILKDKTREVFSNYWCNPSYGEDGKGIYTQFSYSDVDFFLTDDRTWRSADEMPDSINGQPNPDKRMLGNQQLDWLKNALRYSTASFKVVVVGSQVLNPVSPFDKLRDFPIEYGELMRFLADNKIKGVVFLTGDRHHSEVIRVERPGTYSLYDVTVSPLTSGTHVFGSAEKNNPYRVYALDQKQNYGRISITGKTGERILQVNFVGVNGEDYGSWKVSEKELR